MVSALLINDVPVECINKAAVTYHVPAAIIVSVLNVEGGKVGKATPNTNGTYDYGPMQINSIWLDKLSNYGYTKEEIRDNPCSNVWIGTWILSQNVTKNYNNFWYGVGSYNSHHITQNYVYQQKVAKNYYDLINYLSPK